MFGGIMEQSKNILFIGDGLSHLKIKSDSSLAIADSALKKGHKVFWCEPQSICYFDKELFVTNFHELISAKEIKFQEVSKLNFSFFELCFVRKDPPFDEKYKNLCWLLASQNKVKIINSPKALLAFHEKSLPWLAYAEGFILKENIIPTCLTHNLFLVQEFCQQFSESCGFIAKPWLGHGGEGVSLFESKNSLFEFLKTVPIENFMVQPFLPEITAEGDRRVFIVKGRIIFDYVRLPAEGKITANGAQGGSAIIREMTQSQIDLCLKIGKFLMDKNILIAGLDLIGSFVGEINITSPTGIKTYETLATKNCADEILNLLME